MHISAEMHTIISCDVVGLCSVRLACSALRVLPSVSRDPAAGLCVCLGLYLSSSSRGSAFAHLYPRMSLMIVKQRGIVTSRDGHLQTVETIEIGH
jgi:hypothetical protein